MKNQKSILDQVQLPQPVKSIQVDADGNMLHFFNHSDLLPEDMPNNFKPVGEWIVTIQSSAAFYQMMHHGAT